MSDVARIPPQGQIVRPEDAPMVAMIERIAMDPSIPIERLEQMLAMKERLDDKAAEQAFNAAFAAASAEFPPIPLNGRGHNNRPYALLKDIVALTRPILSRHGLTMNWDVEITEKVRVTAHLRHIQGHSATTSILLPSETSGSKNAVQALGSSQSYGERYTAQAILGLALGDDVDDDGNGAGQSPTISEDQYRSLRDLISEAEADEAKFLAHFKIDHLVDLPGNQFRAAEGMLRTKLKAQKTRGQGNG